MSQQRVGGYKTKLLFLRISKLDANSMSSTFMLKEVAHLHLKAQNSVFLLPTKNRHSHHQIKKYFCGVF